MNFSGVRRSGSSSSVPGPSRPVFPGYEYGAESLRSMLHLILKLGIATEKVVSIDTLADRLRTEVVASDGVIKPPDLMGTWAHKC